MKEYEGYFNNSTFKEMKIIVKEYSPYTPANEEYESIAVEGRNGKVHVMKGTYPELKKTFKFLSYRKIELDELKVKLINWISDIKDNKLIYDLDNKAYRVLIADLGEIAKSKGRYNFDITFICESFLTDLQETTEVITNNYHTLKYNGNVEADPVFKIYGYGNIQLTVNNETMVIKNVSDYVTVDSKLLQITDKNGISKDNDAIGNFPTFRNGDNSIYYSGSVAKIELTYLGLYR